MAWTIEEIEKSWLAGSRVAVPPEDVVAAFERCEQILGRDWIEARRARELGTSPTLAVVRMGQRLASLDGVANVGTLVEKLRRGDRSAASELHALHLLRFGAPVTAEMYPAACVAQSNRVPDIRARSPDPWVYVEVTDLINLTPVAAPIGTYGPSSTWWTGSSNLLP
jgi:hypothetical protein